MMLFRKIDNDGLFLEDMIFDKQPMLTIVDTNEEGNQIEFNVPDSQYVAVPVPGGLYRAKWINGEWVEGLSEEEILEITKPAPHEPTESDILMMAIADLDMQREQDKLDQQLAIADLAETLMGGMF